MTIVAYVALLLPVGELVLRPRLPGYHETRADARLCDLLE